MHRARTPLPSLTRRAAQAVALLALLLATIGVSAGPAAAVAEPCNGHVSGYLYLPFPAIPGSVDEPASLEFDASGCTEGASVPVTAITVLIACGMIPTGYQISDCTAFEDGVFDVHSDSTSTNGECGTVTDFVFTESEQPAVYDVTWDGELALPDGADCVINFLVDVAAYPPVDAVSFMPGIQTVGMAVPTWIRDGVPVSTAGANSAWFPPTLETSATPSSAVLGSAVTDVATLAHTAFGEEVPDATGTITFRLFKADADLTCADADLVFTDVQDVDGEGIYTSAEFTPELAGSYLWTATYSGDPRNLATAGTCGEEGESVTVTGPDTPMPGGAVDHPVPSPSPSPTASESATAVPSASDSPPGCVTATISLAASRSRVTSGNTPTLAGTVTDAAGVPCGSTSVTVFAKQYGDSTWAPLATIPTDASGRFSLRVRPTRQTSYGANTADGAVRSNVVPVRVHTRVTLAVPAPPSPIGTPRSVANPATFVGSLNPAYAGVEVGLGTFVGRTFVVLQRTTTDASGGFALSRVLPPGPFTAVVFTSAHGGNDNGSMSIALDVL